jgi:proteasome lid subunit RPN8/RPN11
MKGDFIVPLKYISVNLPKEGLLQIPTVAVVGEGEISLARLAKFGPLVHVLTSKGFMLFSSSELFTSLTETKTVPQLSSVDASLEFVLEKIPSIDCARINRFFQLVYDKYHSEAVVLLYYDPEKKEWMIYCPKQEVTSGTVSYDNPSPVDIEPRFMRMGSWHSHAGMSAFHSGVDRDDEIFNGNGLHLTSGDFNSTPKVITDDKPFLVEPEVVASIVVGDTRFTVDPIDVLEAEVLFIEEESNKITTPFGFQISAGSKSKKKFHALVDLIETEVPEAWMEAVTHRSYTSHGAREYLKYGPIAGGYLGYDKYGDDEKEWWDRFRDHDKKKFETSPEKDRLDDDGLVTIISERTEIEEGLKPLIQEIGEYMGIDLLSIQDRDEFELTLDSFDKNCMECTQSRFTEIAPDTCYCEATSEYVCGYENYQAILCGAWDDAWINNETDSEDNCSDCLKFWESFKKDPKVVPCSRFAEDSPLYSDTLGKMQYADTADICVLFTSKTEADKLVILPTQFAPVKQNSLVKVEDVETSHTCLN